MEQAAWAVGRLEYLDFELEIGTGVEDAYPVRISSPAGDLQTTIRLPYSGQELKNRLLEVENALLRSGQTRRLVTAAPQRTVQDFGQDLFETVLPPDARGLYQQSRREAEFAGRGLRFKLRIEPPELAVLPWEFMYDTRQATFLGLSTMTPIVRDVGLAQPIEPLAVDPPLHVLGMVASPNGLAPLAVEHERLRVEEALRDLRERGLVHVRWVKGETWRDLQREVRRSGAHVFHFIGHGGFDAHTDEGLIALANESGSFYRLPASELAMLLADEELLRLVVLNSCEGARGGVQDVFSGTASILIRRGIPAVLAMQYEITDKAAIEFSRAFYEALADGVPVDAAVSEGRKAVRLASPGSLEWATPVLYQRTANGTLFDLRHNGSSPNLQPERLAAPGIAVPSPHDPPADATATSDAEAGAGAGAATRPAVQSGKQSTRSGIEARWATRSGKAAILAGLVAAIVLIIAAGIVLFDSDGNTSAPRLSGTLTDALITDPMISRGDFCERRGIACQGSNRIWPGNVFSFTIETAGYEGQPLTIRWSVYDAATARQVTDPTLVDQDGWPDGVYTPSRNAGDRNSGEIWIHLPAGPGRFFVRFELFAPDGTRLDWEDSEPFSVS